MRDGQAVIVEAYLDPVRACRIDCPPELVPAPGQYLLADLIRSDSPLAEPIFPSEANSSGFIAAPPIPGTWRPGSILHLRGPLGRGFTLPASSRQVALVAFQNSPAALLALLGKALKLQAEVVLLDDHPPEALPLQVEVQPLASLSEVFEWADYVAVDVRRESLADLQSSLNFMARLKNRPETQILVHTPMPCGGLARCGVCTVTNNRKSLLVCETGPVFDYEEIF